MVGIVTLNDVLAAIVGDFPSEDTLQNPEIVKRADGSWLVDGGISIARLTSLLAVNIPFSVESANYYNTLGGFIISHLNEIPNLADHFDFAGWRYEIVDMDQTRIDKVLITKQHG
jgi:putative hemolysin